MYYAIITDQGHIHLVSKKKRVVEEFMKDMIETPDDDCHHYPSDMYCGLRAITAAAPKYTVEEIRLWAV